MGRRRLVTQRTGTAARRRAAQQPARKKKTTLWLSLRLGLLGVVVLAVAGVAYSLWPKAPEEPVSYDKRVTITMGGFDPAMIDLRAGGPATIWLVNPDSSHHTDGGGVHGFTIPTLGIDVKVQPQSTQLVTLPDTAAGEYPFYCDTCCGGKENPTMNGTIRVNPA